MQLNKRALCRPRYYQPKYHEIYDLRLACTKRYHLHVRRSSAILLPFFSSLPLPGPSPASTGPHPHRRRCLLPGRVFLSNAFFVPARPDKKEIGAPAGTIRPSRASISRDTQGTVFGMPCEIGGKNQYRYVPLDKPFNVGEIVPPRLFPPVHFCFSAFGTSQLASQPFRPSFAVEMPSVAGSRIVKIVPSFP